MHTITFDNHVPLDSIFGHQETFLVLDGEPLEDTCVLLAYLGEEVRLPILCSNSEYSSSLISKVPVVELLAAFREANAWITPIIEGHIHFVTLRRSLSEDSSVLDPQLCFSVSVDMQNWAKPFSIVQFYEALEQVVSKCPTYRFKADLDEDLVNDVEIYIDVEDQRQSISDLVEAYRSSLRDIIVQAYALLAAAIRRDSLVSFFEFPTAFRTACQQYLVYFVEFLRDLGIEADAEIKEESHRVLFSVTPRSAEEGLERIKDALAAYLRLPEAPDMAGQVARYPDVAVAQLYANVLHLRSQLILANSALQMKDATIESLQLSHFQYRQLLLTQDNTPQLPSDHLSSKKRSVDQESVLGGFVSVKRYESKGFVLDLPRLLRMLKRRVYGNQETKT